MLVLLFAVFLFARAAPVVELTGDDFWDKTSQGTWFIKFYAPWCGHCSSLAGPWQNLADEIEPEGVNVAKIDCTQLSTELICHVFKVNGFPSLQLVKDGRSYSYPNHGARTAPVLLEWATDGYKNIESNPVPPRPNVMTYVNVVYEQITKTIGDAWKVAPVPVVFFAAVGFLLGYYSAGYGLMFPSVKYVAKPKTQ